MIKVLIVDDEPKLREGLRTFIDWEAEGYQVVDTAVNGKDALDKYKIHDPDLVLADIRMPGMDGLQLIQRLRMQDPLLHILILSGYADFNYAKTAMTQRADGYLLKPVDEDELLDYLRNIKRVIEEEKASEQWKRVTSDWNREALIQSIVMDEGLGEEQSAQLYERAGQVGIQGKAFQIMLLSLQAGEEAEARTDAAARKALIHLFEQSERGWVFSIHAKLGVLLKEPLLSVETEGIYRSISQALSGCGAYFSIALGDKVTNLAEARHSYRTAYELIRQQFVLDHGEVLMPGMLQASAAARQGEARTAEELGDQLYFAVDIGNRTAVKTLLPELGQLYMDEALSEIDIKDRFAELLTTIMHKVLDQSSGQPGRQKEFTGAFAEMQKARTILDLYDKAESLLEQLMSQLGEDSKHREVKIMLDLIHRNYNESLKLETLSSIFNYNSAYLGKLFKNTTGEYFNTYIDKVRIEKAKTYLEEGLKVYQVAEKVGYTNVDYFHSKFRKYVGTSPSAYRKQSNHA
ncbi:response regulator transcription factor [Paenibacillus senegalimassiliensis]|uniref:response regulator transcription factor n=1 Tax=Paenibacillus senegalimassiliensis TaxID=1737426 RepID=UPI00073E5B28|nr:response regulator transcription factor [Paenibacillus senegalimassiliensis]